MILSDRSIREALDEGAIKINPLGPNAIQPTSIDVRLGHLFRVFNSHRYSYIDPLEEQPDLTEVVALDPDDVFTLHPGEFVLASTFEVVQLDDGHAAALEGKSSLGRLGLVVHQTAGWIDPGFNGAITLEMSNATRLPIRLRPRMWVGQLVFFATSSRASRPYGHPELGSRYQGDRGPEASRYHLQDNR